MAAVVAIVMLFQFVSPWAYTLEDQNEPEYLALRTQYGTMRILPDQSWECSYILANQNVQIVGQDAERIVLVPDGEGLLPWCRAALVAQVDEFPCFTNGWGDCDVRMENE